MEYNPNTSYGLLGVPLCVKNGSIYKAKIDNIIVGTDVTDTNSWETLSSSSSGLILDRVNKDANFTIDEDNINRYFLVNTSTSAITITIDKTNLDNMDMFGVAVKGGNIATATSSSLIDGATDNLLIYDKEYYVFVYDKDDDDFFIYNKEEKKELSGDVTHTLYFKDIGGKLVMYLDTAQSSTNIDFTGINMDWTDGNGAFVSSPSSIDIQYNIKTKQGIKVN